MSITDILNIDTIICISDYLKDYDKINFIKTCQEYYNSIINQNQNLVLDQILRVYQNYRL